MAQETLNLGTNANDHTGDTLRAAFQKVENNFTELFSGQLGVYTAATLPTGTAGQIIYVSNGDGGSPCLAVFDGTDWKIVSLGSAI